MTSDAWFWLFYVLTALAGVFGWYRTDPPNRWWGGAFLFFMILFFLIGLEVFGSPRKG